jgi:hypothetical protein
MPSLWRAVDVMLPGEGATKGFYSYASTKYAVDHGRTKLPRRSWMRERLR